MSKAVFVLLFCVVLSFLISTNAYAIFDPLSRPNNFRGIHILFPSELAKAASLVNSGSGQWGYVTIPIQSDDKDLVKWQNFMDECKKLKLIPIIRLATTADPQNTSVWAKPTETDILDFANFLDSLSWPIENRYVILFNEENRFDEWGGEAPDPKAYADLVSYANSIFKSESPDFYLILGGLDNAAPNDGIKFVDNYVYLREMQEYSPGIFDLIDGFSSHSYPNPGFSQPPEANQREGITTYQYEYSLINSFTNKKIPAFITETGWDSKKLGDNLVSYYYKIAYQDFWGKDKDKIVAITPFLLDSQGGGPFDTFSFIQNGKPTTYFDTQKDQPKVKGEPEMAQVEGASTVAFPKLATKDFESNTTTSDYPKQFLIDYVKFFF